MWRYRLVRAYDAPSAPSLPEPTITRNASRPAKQAIATAVDLGTAPGRRGPRHARTEPTTSKTPSSAPTPGTSPRCSNAARTPVTTNRRMPPAVGCTERRSPNPRYHNAYPNTSGAVWNRAMRTPRCKSTATPTTTTIGSAMPEHISPAVPAARPSQSRRSRGPGRSAHKSCAKPKTSEPTNVIWKARAKSWYPLPNSTNNEAAVVASHGRTPQRFRTASRSAASVRCNRTTNIRYGV
jgi:hypothetical protein